MLSVVDTYILMTISELTLATKGSCLCDYAQDEGCHSVVTDSRNVTPGSLFVPLMGEAQDGHGYIPAALKAGARVFFVDTAHGEGSAGMFTQLAKQYNASCIMVENTLHALQDAARAYVRKFPSLKRIAVTGSSGKTTTKELTAAIFSQEYSVIANEGNLNSETGLPLSVFRIRPEHEVGIFELGMNRRGEMLEITSVLNPETALITNIGTAHIGILGSREAIAEEKKSVFSFFTDTCNGFVFEDDDYRDFLKNGSGQYHDYGKNSTQGVHKTESRGLHGWTIYYEDQIIEFPMPGPYNLINAFGAISLARAYDIRPDKIKKGLETVKPLFGRTEISQGTVTSVFDYYNANPQSMREALLFCDALPWDGEKIFILGSMLELGAATESTHRDICLIADISNASHIMLFGEDMIRAAKSISWTHESVFFAETMEDLIARVSAVLTPNALVFIKGSRGMALERLRPVLEHFTVEEERT